MNAAPQPLWYCIKMKLAEPSCSTIMFYGVAEPTCSTILFYSAAEAKLFNFGCGATFLSTYSISAPDLSY